MDRAARLGLPFRCAKYSSGGKEKERYELPPDGSHLFAAVWLASMVATDEHNDYGKCQKQEKIVRKDNDSLIATQLRRLPPAIA